MTCGLTEEEIDVLYWFYSKHLLSERATLHEEAVYRRLEPKVGDPEGTIKGLRTKGYIGKHKTMCLYANPRLVLISLGSHRPHLLARHLRRGPGAY